MRQVTKWEAEDGSLHDTEGAALKADLGHAVKAAAAELASAIRPAYGDAEDIARDMLDRPALVIKLAAAMHAETVGPGAQDMRTRAGYLAACLRRMIRAGNLLGGDDQKEILAFCEDVALLPVPALAGAAREPGPLERAGRDNRIIKPA